ncbi:MAG: DUF4251 domain-containing protein [Rikenellaceae bacterium]
MKKILFVSIILMILSGSQLYAQEKSKKELRKENRDAALVQEKEMIAQILNEQDFEFIAVELVSSGTAMISNVRLNGLWGITVTPNTFKCYLPVYGMSSPVGRPTLLRRLDFFTKDFKIKMDDAGSRGTTITIVSSDNVGNKSYTFRLMVTPNGRMSTLVVSSDFTAPVSFSGNLNY